jgi:hypothetical protein
MKLNEFRIFFTEMNRPWYFAKPDDTTHLLKEIGYTNTRVSLHNDCVSLTNRKIYARFVKTVIIKPFLERLPRPGNCVCINLADLTSALRTDKTRCQYYIVGPVQIQLAG